MKIGLSDVSLSLVAGQERALEVQGEYLLVVEASGPVTITNERGERVTRQAGDGCPMRYEGLKIASTTAQTVTLSVGFLGGMPPVSGNRLSVGSLTVLPAVANSTSSPSDVNCPAGTATMIRDASATRLRIAVSIPTSAGAGTIRIGDASVGAARGLELLPGDKASDDTKAAIYVYNGTAAAFSVGVIEDFQ